MDINTYITTPEVQSIIMYWRQRYSHNCTTFTKEELLSEAYLGAWETILRYSSVIFKDLLKLISLGVKWKLCNYIRTNQTKWSKVGVTEHIDNKGYSDNIEDNVECMRILTSYTPKQRLIINMKYQGYSGKETGEVLDISKQRVNQILIKCRKQT